MLEVRYITATGVITAWCGDKAQFGNLDRGRETEEIVVIDTSVSSLGLDAYLFDKANQALTPNPVYVEPKPLESFVAEGSNANLRIKTIEDFLTERYG